MLNDKIQLESDEKVLLQVRKHWFIIAAELAGVLLAAFLPLLLYAAFTYIPSELIRIGAYLAAPFIVALYASWLLLLWMVAFSIWTNYYLDVWTITNKRLIAVDQRGFFHRSIGSFRLERLQDLNVEINGIIATLLDFGTLEAETAGAGKDEFRATGLPHPRELKAVIVSATDVLMREYKGAIRDEL